MVAARPVTEDLRSSPSVLVVSPPRVDLEAWLLDFIDAMAQLLLSQSWVRVQTLHSGPAVETPAPFAAMQRFQRRSSMTKLWLHADVEYDDKNHRHSRSDTVLAVQPSRGSYSGHGRRGRPPQTLHVHRFMPTPCWFEH